MLADRRIRQLFDYTNADELFPGIDLEGGVCYFLWDRDNVGACATTTHRGNEVSGPVDRDLNQFDIFVRDTRGLPILQKVLDREEASFANLVSGDTPFGLASNFKGYRKSDKKQSGDLKLLMNEGGQRVEHWIDQTLVSKNVPLIKVWKVLVPKARGTQAAPDVVLGTPIVAAPSSVCSQTYLVIGPLGSKAEAESLDAYLHTRFVRFLVSLRKISQDAMKSVYTWVPQQAWDRTWTDAELYKKYGITKDEQEYIAEMIKEMPA
jgi:site-specific DNA-methyltransferase (adenine-specific)